MSDSDSPVGAVGQTISYGGDGHLDPDDLATLIELVQSHASDVLGDHWTMIAKTWDDGTVSVRAMETLQIMPGVGKTPPAKARQEVRCQENKHEIQYRRYLERGPDTEVKEQRTLQELKP